MIRSSCIASIVAAMIASAGPAIAKTITFDNGGLFGSVGIPFSGSGMAGKWKRVRGQIGAEKTFLCGGSPCNQATTSALGVFLANRSGSFLEKLERANSLANSVITYQSDRSVYGELDYWAAPAESLARQRGDCEDYAILKLALLEAIGIPTSSMSVVILKDTKRDLYHAVLAVSTNKGNFILDNVRNNVVFDHQIRHYMPLVSFSENRSWIHGWKKHSPYLAGKGNPLAENILPGLAFRDCPDSLPVAFAP